MNASARSIGFWTWVAWGAACLLIFTHGCHGPDEDHELFTKPLIEFKR